MRLVSFQRQQVVLSRAGRSSVQRNEGCVSTVEVSEMKEKMGDVVLFERANIERERSKVIARASVSERPLHT
jgi:hypothetical protein